MAEVGTGDAIAGRMGADLRCPLCDYDVRGLPEPRCSECGHSFDWEEVTNPQKRRLPWFVEHAPFWRSYWSTQKRLLWPDVFWRRVKPNHAIFRRRAWAFWAVGFGLIFALLVAATAADVVSLNRSFANTRAVLNGSPDALAYLAANAKVSQNEYLNSMAPKIDTPQFWQKVWQTSTPGKFTLRLLTPSVSLWLVLGLTVRTFPSARALRGHVGRVVAYAADPFPLIVGLLFAFTVYQLTWIVVPSTGGLGEWGRWLVLPAYFLSFVVIPWLRTEAAVRRYFGLRHGWAVATATLLVTGTAMWLISFI